MANYVYNRIICSKETMYKYFIDYNPFNDKEEKFKIHPYITFNKLYNVKDLNEYYINMERIFITDMVLRIEK